LRAFSKDDQELSAQMGVFTVPTVRFYMDGKLAVDESGYFSLDRMLDRMERYLKIL
jgi:thioredoxin 1